MWCRCISIAFRFRATHPKSRSDFGSVARNRGSPEVKKAQFRALRDGPRERLRCGRGTDLRRRATRNTIRREPTYLESKAAEFARALPRRTNAILNTPLPFVKISSLPLNIFVSWSLLPKPSSPVLRPLVHLIIACGEFKPRELKESDVFHIHCNSQVSYDS